MSNKNSPNTSTMVAAGEKKPSAVGYKILAILVLVLAVGGLFLGLAEALADKVAFLSFLKPADYHVAFNVFADGAADKWYGGSLLGNIIVLFTDLFKGREILSSVGLHFALESAEQIAQLAFYWLHFLLVLAVVITLVCTIISLCSSKMARFGAYVGAYLTLLAYGALFAIQLFAFNVNIAGESDVTLLSSIMAVLDLPTLFIAGVVLLLLSLTGILRRKGLGLLRFFLLVLSLAAVCGFFFPQEAANGNTAFLLGKAIVKGSDLNLWFRIVLIAACALVVVNLVFSVLQLSAKRYYIFDVARFLLQLLVVIALALLLWLMPYNVEGRDAAVFAKMSLILLLSASLSAFLLALLMAIVHAVKKRKAAANPATAPVATTAQPVVTETVVVKETTVAHQDRPMSEFERSMAALANGQAPATAPQEPVAQPQPAQTTYYAQPQPQQAQPAQMTFYAQPQSQSKPQVETSPITTYTSAQHLQDEFMDTLTEVEQSEFGDLFIAGKRGELKYLPTYIIGGDNTEFFRKVFIYLGRFRKDISGELLDKLYSYVSKLD